MISFNGSGCVMSMALDDCVQEVLATEDIVHPGEVTCVMCAQSRDEGW